MQTDSLKIPVPLWIHVVISPTEMISGSIIQTVRISSSEIQTLELVLSKI